MNSYVRAIQNYNRVLDATKSIKPLANAKESTAANILREGDNIKILNLSSQNKPFFPKILSDVFTAETRKIEKARKKIADIFKISPKGDPVGASLVKLTDILNTTKIALLQITALREKFVNAYQEIIKMPL